MGVLQPEVSSGNTFFKLGTVTNHNYITVGTEESAKEYEIDLSTSNPTGGVYTNGILVYLAPKTNDGYTYTITNVTLVEKR